VTLQQANQHARNVGLQLLAALREATGSLDKMVRVGRVFGIVNAAPDFADHPKGINGCSDLFVEVFGDRGRHARCAVGMGSLPFFNMTVVAGEPVKRSPALARLACAPCSSTGEVKPTPALARAAGDAVEISNRSAVSMRSLGLASILCDVARAAFRG
jgi:enamine deaminase RidA (YjgF/YER057c/UK114 family)